MISPSLCVMGDDMIESSGDPEIDSFSIGENILADFQNVDAQTHHRLQALLQAAGITKLPGADVVRAFTADPDIIRRLTSSVSYALDEAASTITRMKPDEILDAMSSNFIGDLKLVDSTDLTPDQGKLSQPAAATNSNAAFATESASEDGESLLSLACSAGYYELAQASSLAMRTNVENRGQKGDSTPLMEAASTGHADIVQLLIKHGCFKSLKMPWVGLFGCRRELLAEETSLRWVVVVRFIARELLTGLDAVHGVNIWHRDIKPLNLLISVSGRINLANLGCCVLVPSERGIRNSTVGTTSYLAPELVALLLGQTADGYDAKVDIWASGITIMEVATLGNPYLLVSCENESELFDYIVREEPPSLRDPSLCLSSRVIDNHKLLAEAKPKRHYPIRTICPHAQLR